MQTASAVYCLTFRAVGFLTNAAGRLFSDTVTKFVRKLSAMEHRYINRMFLL